MTVTALLRKRLEPMTTENKCSHLSLTKIRKLNWNQKFIILMHNRMTQGYFRYGLMGVNKYKNIASILARLRKYCVTGNTEHLIDVANLCLIEFTHSQHTKKHFKSIDDGEHSECR